MHQHAWRRAAPQVKRNDKKLTNFLPKNIHGKPADATSGMPHGYTRLLAQQKSSFKSTTYMTFMIRLCQNRGVADISAGLL